MSPAISRPIRNYSEGIEPLLLVQATHLYGLALKLDDRAVRWRCHSNGEQAIDLCAKNLTKQLRTVRILVPVSAMKSA